MEGRTNDELVKRLRAQAEVERFFAGEEMLYLQAADAIEELSKKYLASEVDNTNLTGWLAEEHAKHLWIPVTERLPEKRKAHYLCYLDDDSIAVCYWSNVSIKGSVWEWHNPNWKEVTHWMPLPEPPKEE